MIRYLIFEYRIAWFASTKAKVLRIKPQNVLERKWKWTMSPSISIIIPIYNKEQYLDRCLTSVLSQSFKDIEVILVDDGSQDNSGSICDKYAAKDNHITVIHKEHNGVSSARNVGIEIARGLYIGFIDADDYVEADMCEKMYRITQQYDVDIVSSNLFYYSDGDKKVIEHNLKSGVKLGKDYIYSNIVNRLAENYTIAIFAFTIKFFKTTLIKKNRIKFNEEIQYAEDRLFSIETYANAKSLFFMDEAFYNYQPNSNGLYSKYREEFFDETLVFREHLFKMIAQYNIPNATVEKFDDEFLYYLTFYLYRTPHYVKEKKRKEKLINNVLDNDQVIATCKRLSQTAVSFDRRIARAIANRKRFAALGLINFVYSGQKERLMNSIVKLRKLFGWIKYRKFQ